MLPKKSKAAKPSTSSPRTKRASRKPIKDVTPKRAWPATPLPATTPPAPPARLADELAAAVNEAVQTGRYMVAVWSVSAGRLRLFRQTSDFPVDDFKTAQSLLSSDIEARR